MIDRIKEAFENGKAFIPFITSGDPSLETTEQLVYAMDDAGADIIELGVPFLIQRLKVLSFRQQICVRFQRVRQRTRFFQ